MTTVRPLFTWSAAMAVLLAVIFPLAMRSQNTGPNGYPLADRGAKWAAYYTATDTEPYTLQAPPAANNRVYLYQAWCNNTSITSTVAYVKADTTIIDAVLCPAGSRSAVRVWNPPLKMAPNKYITLVPAANTTTLYLTAQGTVAP